MYERRIQATIDAQKTVLHELACTYRLIKTYSLNESVRVDTASRKQHAD